MYLLSTNKRYVKLGHISLTQTRFCKNLEDNIFKISDLFLIFIIVFSCDYDFIFLFFFVNIGGSGSEETVKKFLWVNLGLSTNNIFF